MNRSPAWRNTLVARGHDAVHWREVGEENAPDEDIMAWAAQDGRVILTADLDFAAAIAVRGLAAPSVVQLRSGSTDPDQVGGFVLQAIQAAEPDLRAGAILTIDAGHARLRPGPDQSPMTDEQ